jgi:predicted phosphodiesterase
VRVAALFDVHGNLPALEAVLAEVEDAGADRVVVGGDIALGPLPAETLALLRGLGERAVFVRGNCEREVAAAGPGAQARWAAAQLDAEARSFLAGLPLTASLDVPGLGPVLFCHATPRSDEEILTRVSPAERVSPALAGVREAVVVCGHTHVQYDRALGETRLVNAGSVGMPYEERPGAYWALLGPEVELRRTDYDLEKAAAAIRASGFPEAAAFAAENVLTTPGPDEATEHFERQATATANAAG